MKCSVPSLACSLVLIMDEILKYSQKVNTHEFQHWIGCSNRFEKADGVDALLLTLIIHIASQLASQFQ